MEGRLLGGRYRIIRPIGSGGMGTVYLCQHAVLGRRYALKVLHADRAADPELVERFRQEAQAASRIDQENVVDVLDYGQDPGGELYYVMEILDGRTLAQVMREDGLLPVDRALGLLEQVCRALAAAHANGVIHRDVKPDNVLVERLPDGTERAKLIDFGISHIPEVGRLTRDGGILGTPEYMSPEQASGAEVNALTDVYAAGVLAYELLTGALPLEGTTAIATMVAHQIQAPPRPGLKRAGLPPEVDRIVLRALAKHPSERFSSIEAMATAVQRARLALEPAAASRREERASRAGSEPRGPTLASSDRALRRLALVAGLVALAAATVLGVMLSARTGTPPGAEPVTTAPVAPAIHASAVPAPPATAPPAVEEAPSKKAQPPEEPRAATAPPPAASRPVVAPRPQEKPAPAKPPAGEDLHDPYAVPADSLKADPFR